MDVSNNQMPRVRSRSAAAGFSRIWRTTSLVSLIMDSRVNPLIKILPISTLVYLISPINLLSLTPSTMR